MKKRVVIVGGGYAGIRAMQHLSSTPYMQVTLIDQHPYHYLQTEAYALIAHHASLIDVTVDLTALCASYDDVTFVKATVLGVDFDARKVMTDKRDFFYDYVILAMGSRTYFPESVPGLHQYSHGVKSLQRAFEFRQRFEQELYERMCSEGDEQCRSFSIVVAGAGLSGVEIAAEMADYTRRFMRENRMMCDGIDIHLIASHEDVLVGMHPYLKRHAKKRLLDLGVEIVSESRVTSVEAGNVLLSTGRTIAFDFMIFAGGIIASTVTKNLDVPCNKKGQITVEPTLKIVGKEDAFAIGDVAELMTPEGKPVPATANGAEKSAELAAVNILRNNRSEKMLSHGIRLEGYIVALGRYNAAVVLFNTVKFSGMLGYIVKRLITDRYKFLLDKRAYRAFRRFKV